MSLSSSEDIPNKNQFRSMEVSDAQQFVTLCGIKLKKNVKRRNAFAILFVFFMITASGGYLNVQTVYLIRDKKYFQLSEDS